MGKKLFSVILLTGVLISVCALTSHAYYGKANKDGKKQLAENFFKKVYTILQNENDLKITDKQKEKILDLKIETKKTLIRSNAEIEIIGMDINKELKQDKIDIKAVNKLIDQKYDLKKQKAKSLVESCANLKEILNKEQKDMLQEIQKEQMKKWHHRDSKGKCPYSASESCPKKM